jgi:DNA replication protein DnaC
MVEALPARVAQAEAAPLPHLEFLELLVEDELARRADRLFARGLEQAGITTMKTLADVDWTFNPKLPKTKIVELTSARFVDTHRGVLLIGPPGVGKSHIATAIAIGAIRAGHARLCAAPLISRPTSTRRMPPASDAIWSGSSRESISSSSRTSG